MSENGWKAFFCIWSHGNSGDSLINHPLCLLPLFIKYHTICTSFPLIYSCFLCTLLWRIIVVLYIISVAQKPLLHTPICITFTYSPTHTLSAWRTCSNVHLLPSPALAFAPLPSFSLSPPLSPCLCISKRKTERERRKRGAPKKPVSRDGRVTAGCCVGRSNMCRLPL